MKGITSQQEAAAAVEFQLPFQFGKDGGEKMSQGSLPGAWSREMTF